MPDMEVMDLLQAAVVWPPDGRNEYGEVLRGAPSQLVCRWVDGQSEALADDGTVIAIDATVIVKQDIEIGSTMWLGTLAAWNLVGTGQVMYVRTFTKTPDIQNRRYRRSVGLTRYRSTLPDPR